DVRQCVKASGAAPALRSTRDLTGQRLQRPQLVWTRCELGEVLEHATALYLRWQANLEAKLRSGSVLARVVHLVVRHVKGLVLELCRHAGHGLGGPRDRSAVDVVEHSTAYAGQMCRPGGLQLGKASRGELGDVAPP